MPTLTSPCRTRWPPALRPASSVMCSTGERAGTRPLCLRRRVLGLDVLKAHDTRAPLQDFRLQVPYEQAVEWVAAVVARLGEEYVQILRKGALEARWVDVYPNKGKRMGAFSTGVPDTFPFILMSYNDDIFAMSTLAHELGHSMHSHYARGTQPFVYSNYGLFQAEVASNMHQALTRRYLLDTQNDPEFQIAVLEEAMANFYRYFFIMPTLARLELELHERVERGIPITAAYLTDLTADLMAEVYGDEVDISGPARPGRSSTPTCTATSTSINTRPGSPAPTTWPAGWPAVMRAPRSPTSHFSRAGVRCIRWRD